MLRVMPGAAKAATLVSAYKENFIQAHRRHCAVRPTCALGVLFAKRDSKPVQDVVVEERVSSACVSGIRDVQLQYASVFQVSTLHVGTGAHFCAMQ